MSMISTALSGLVAAQRGLEVTSNNVSNAGTDGYVRRRTIQAEAITAGAGVKAGLGSGVQITEVQRLYDNFLADSLRSATSLEQRSQVLTDLTARLDSVFGDPDLGIGASTQAFFDRVELLSRDPTSASNRQQVLLQGESLAQRFQQLDSQLNALGDEIDRRLGDSVARINNIADSLAKINAAIGRGIGASNDLEDRREALLSELSLQLDTTVLRQEDGTVTVMVGSGQPLVLGIEKAELTLTADDFDPTRMQVSINYGQQWQAISRQVSGGALGGLLAFRGEALDGTRRELGLMATTLANAFNEQHALGADANGNLGGAFFDVPVPVVLTSAANSGSANVNASIADPTALAAHEYELRYDGAAWSLRDAATGQAVSMTGAGTVASPFLFEGVSVTVTGSAAVGDRFVVRPVTGAAGAFSVALADANAIATASPVRSSRSLANVSDAAISVVGVADINDPSLQQPVEIRFESATTFRVFDSGNNDLSGPLTYTNGADITFNGWTVRITGSAATGDEFSVSPIGLGSGDNSNALALARVGSQAYLGGQVSVDGLSARLVADVGSAAMRHRQDLEVQSALREQATLDLEAIAGVNLDEEAANLMRYQQAYQAATKIISVSDELFRTLLGIIA
jgi:flagellar hook-associated protein 1 FlgK